MDQIADNLIVVATHSVEFGDEFLNTDSDMINDYFPYEIEYDAESYTGIDNRVQLGDKMWVEISVDTTVKGLGIFEIPVTLRVKRSGISERYWKE